LPMLLALMTRTVRPGGRRCSRARATAADPTETRRLMRVPVRARLPLLPSEIAWISPFRCPLRRSGHGVAHRPRIWDRRGPSSRRRRRLRTGGGCGRIQDCRSVMGRPKCLDLVQQSDDAARDRALWDRRVDPVRLKGRSGPLRARDTRRPMRPSGESELFALLDRRGVVIETTQVTTVAVASAASHWIG
jgi:hypothetical protein